MGHYPEEQPHLIRHGTLREKVVRAAHESRLARPLVVGAKRLLGYVLRGLHDGEDLPESHKPLKIGPITCAGIVFLSLLFLLRLNPDRKFSGSGSQPEKVAVADIVAGKVSAEKFVAIDGSAEPLLSHSIRTMASKGSLGLRVVPVRGTGDKLWLVVNGDGWTEPEVGAYVGRLRPLSELPFAGA